MSETREVGDWILEREIGSGSFARVWKATHRHSQKVAAVKDINVDKLNNKLQESLASEVAVLNHTKHRNIVCLLDLIRDSNRLFIVLEYCDGGDLGHYIKRYRQATEATARYFLRQLAEGLKELRRHNVIHRDLKPQNLLLSDSSSTPLLKIADFGFARSLAPQGLAETLCGSPLYMAPEILQFHKYDAKADLWSIGTILFELLAGKPPFNGANHVQLLRNIERHDAKLPDQVAARLSAPCKSLLECLLQRNPVERISFEEFFTHPFLTGDAGPSIGVPPSQPYSAAMTAGRHVVLPTAMKQAAVTAAAAATAAGTVSAVGLPRPSLLLHRTLAGHAQQQQQQQQPLGWQQHEHQQQPYPLATNPPPIQQHSRLPPQRVGLQLQQRCQPQQQLLLVSLPVAHHPLAAEAEPAEPLSDSMEGDFVVVYNPNGSGQGRSCSNSNSSKASSGLVDPRAAAVLQSAAPSARATAWLRPAGQQQLGQQLSKQGEVDSWPISAAAGQHPLQQHHQQPAGVGHAPGGHLVMDAVGDLPVPEVTWASMPPHSQLVPGGTSDHTADWQEPSAAQRVQLLVQVVRGCASLMSKQLSGTKDTVLPATQQSEHLALLLLALQLVQAMCLPHSVQQCKWDSEQSQQRHQHREVAFGLTDLLAAASQVDLEQLMSATVSLLAVARVLTGSASSEATDTADLPCDSAAGLGSLGKMSQSLLQVQLPDPCEVLFQQALHSCRSAAVEEVMGNWQGSIAGYSLAADLLLFLSIEWRQLGPADPCLTVKERRAVHNVYAAVNDRLAVVVAEASSYALH